MKIWSWVWLEKERRGKRGEGKWTRKTPAGEAYEISMYPKFSRDCFFKNAWTGNENRVRIQWKPLSPTKMVTELHKSHLLLFLKLTRMQSSVFAILAHPGSLLDFLLYLNIFAFFHSICSCFDISFTSMISNYTFNRVIHVTFQSNSTWVFRISW